MKFSFWASFSSKFTASSGKTVKPINPLNLWMFRLVTTQTLTSIQLIRPSFFSRHKSLSLLMMRWRNTAAGADGGPTPVSRGVSSQAVFWLEKPKTRNLQFHHQMMFAKKKNSTFLAVDSKKGMESTAELCKTGLPFWALDDSRQWWSCISGTNTRVQVIKRYKKVLWDRFLLTKVEISSMRFPTCARVHQLLVFVMVIPPLIR